MKLLRIAAWALALVLATTAHADAAPIAAAIGAIAGLIKAGGIIGSLVQLAIGMAINLGISLIMRAMQKKPPEPGVKVQVEIGDDHPAGSTVGEYATPGTRVYAGAWGNVGNTPNAYLVDVIQIGDLPAPGQPGIWVSGEKVTVLWNETPTAQGYPVLEYRVNGTDYLWVKYRDGTETTPDAYLRDKFGSDPERPWEADMIGRGAPHVIFTARFNRDLFRGLEWLIEPPAQHFYDLRKDSTAGGSGSHRWGDHGTYEPTTNPAVIAYNILRGIHYDDGTMREWLFGGQDLPAWRFPAANWMAAMNECDALVNIDGGTEPFARCGYEIRCDMNPLDVVEELMKGCLGTVVEVGGRFKIHVGAPAAPVYSFTDGDVLITEASGFKPFPSISDTVNGIEATAPFPAEAWRMRDAPALYDEDFEEEDGDRRLPVGVQFPTVPYPVQVQRLMKAMLKDARRWRVHVLPMPPDASALEPGVDTIAWTSARNGYVDKKFTIERVIGRRTRCPVLIVREVDPSDYDWSPGDQQPVPPPVWTGPSRPPAQPMTGWAVQGITVSGRRPGIQTFFDGNQDDVRAVRIQVREDFGAGNVVFDGEAPYGEPEPGLKDQVLSGLWTLPNADYEVRGIFLPFSGRRTEWSAWLGVTTPNVLLGGPDLYPIDLDQLEQDVTDFLDWTGAGARAAFDEIRALALQISNLSAEDVTERQSLRRELSVSIDGVRGDFEEIIAFELGPTGAIGIRLTSLEVEIDGKASVSALNSLTTTVTNQGGEINALGIQISALEVVVDGKASASALNSLQTQVNTQGGQITALADDISILDTTVGQVSANVTLRATAQASPGGGYSRWGAQVRTSGSTWDSSAGFFIDTHSTQPSRFVVTADQFIVVSGGNAAAPLAFVGGTLYVTGARMQWAQIDNVSIGTADIANAAITTAKINNAAITSAKIGTAEVGTLKLSPGASSETSAGSYTHLNATGRTLTAPDHTTGVIVTISGQYSIADGSTVQATIQKNGTDISSSLLPPHVTSGNGTFTYQLTWIDTNTSPSNTFTARVGVGTANQNIGSGSIRALWLKR